MIPDFSILVIFFSMSVFICCLQIFDRICWRCRWSSWWRIYGKEKAWISGATGGIFLLFRCSECLIQRFNLPDTQDDPLRLFIHRQQDGTHRGGQELRHHRQHPAKQQQQCRHCCLQQGRSAQLAQIQESRVSVGILVELLLLEEDGAVGFARCQAYNCKTFLKKKNTLKLQSESSKRSNIGCIINT